MSLVEQSSVPISYSVDPQDLACSSLLDDTPCHRLSLWKVCLLFISETWASDTHRWSCQDSRVTSDVFICNIIIHASH